MDGAGGDHRRPGGGAGGAPTLAAVPRRRPLPFDPIEEAARNWASAGWGDAAPGMAFVTSIMRVQQLVLARVDDALGPHGLTFARFELLMLLDFSRQGELPLSRIGRRLQVHPASVTNAVDRLEADGLVRRRPNPADGRGTLAAITPAGRRLVRHAAASLNEVFVGLGLAAEEEQAVVRTLAAFRRAAGDFDDAPA